MIDTSDMEWYYWSDSADALAWLKREENWQTFVHNRVTTVKKFTSVNDWRHVPGKMNPADLPTRGCSSAQLLRDKWWEGPAWLKKGENE